MIEIKNQNVKSLKNPNSKAVNHTHTGGLN